MALISADLFPTKLSLVVFVSYMGLFINQGILVTASKSKDNSYNYNTVTVVLVTEILKLVAAAVVFMKDHTVANLFGDIVKHRKVLFLYFIPAALYCLYNNLQFVNLSTYDPTTYYLLLQFRVVVTGVVFQIVFKKSLSRIQWASLLLLTVGCIIKEVRHDVSAVASDANASTSILDYFDIHLLFIMLQVFSSCFAGVYNEFLLKDTGADVHIMMANVFMYLNSIVCNVLVLMYRGQLLEAFRADSIASIMQPGVIAIAVNNAAIGIVTSLFLRNLNSILKTFASALELMFTAVLCWIIFNIPVDMYTVLAIFIVSAATYLYAQNPVVNKAKHEISGEVKDRDDSEALLAGDKYPLEHHSNSGNGSKILSPVNPYLPQYDLCRDFVDLLRSVSAIGYTWCLCVIECRALASLTTNRVWPKSFKMEVEQYKRRHNMRHVRPSWSVSVATNETPLNK